MLIRSLHIQNLRLIQEAEFHFSPVLNFISGSNASGKTTLLEAIYLLGRGKSFQSVPIPSVIRKGEKNFLIAAEVQKSIEDHPISIGIRRFREKSEIYISGEKVKRTSELAQLLPVQLINPDSIQMIFGSPKLRRNFLDWGMFHVEHSFLSVWQDYRKLLRQRNALLKGEKLDQKERTVWDVSFSRVGEQFNQYRKNYLKELLQQYQEVFSGKIAGLQNVDIQFSYQKGWKEIDSLQDALESSARRDLKQGYTSVGPHEADFKILADGVEAKRYLSRGQGKLLSIALLIAQVLLLYKRAGKRSVILIDDLFAELDQKNYGILLEYLLESGMQIFVTSTSENLEVPQEKTGQIKMFHVEHGVFTERSAGSGSGHYNAEN